MNRDLPDDLGSLDPGVDELLSTLTGAPTAGELAGEQQALTMFRSSQHPTARLARGPAPVPPRWRWRLVLAGGAFAVLVGGLASAAYAAALPAPVQNFAARNLSFLGVPPVHHGKASHAPPAGRSTAPGGQHGTASPPRPAPARSGSASHRGRPSVSTAPRVPKSPKAKSPKAPVLPDLLKATVPAGLIIAGDPASMDGMLSRSGTAVPGARVTLLERPAGATRWQVVGSGTTNSSGNVTLQVSALVSNAVFRLAGPDRSQSQVVRISVSPPITFDLKLGARAIRDVLVVSTLFARPGNVVVLQVRQANGDWVGVMTRMLNGSGKARFVLNARVLKNDTIRVKLRATLRHAASVSSALTVPAPT